MKGTSIFKTKANNSYVFDKNMNYTIFIPKLLENEIIADTKKMDNCNDDSYYVKKLKWLYNHGFFKKNDVKFSSLLPNDICSSIEYIDQVVFEVTDKCNLSCKYCAYGELYGDFDERKNIDMPVSSAKLVLDYLVDTWKNSGLEHYPPKKIYLSFYGGEPLLNISFIKEIVAYSKEIESSYFFFENTMTTNAVLLDRYMDFLIKENFELLISLDGNQENNSYRVYHSGKGSFGKVYNNIKALQKNYPDYFEKRVSINSVLHNKNGSTGYRVSIGLICH